jgi:hypothetical protein
MAALLMLALFCCRKNGKDREGPFPPGSLDTAAHTFQEYTYKKITPCDICSQVLRGAYCPARPKRKPRLLRICVFLLPVNGDSWCVLPSPTQKKTSPPSHLRLSIACYGDSFTFFFPFSFSFMISSKFFDQPVCAFWIQWADLKAL